MAPDINPRYACYCAAHGYETTIGMMKRDQQVWKGGVMAGFILWNNDQIRKFFEQSTAHHFKRGELLSDNDHALYDMWLQEKFPKCHAVKPPGVIAA